MAGLLQGAFALLVFGLVLRVLLAAMLGGLYEWRSWRYVADRLRPPAPARPTRRPLSAIAEDARRISASYHHDGMRFAQYEGRRQAFDRILAEASAAIGLDHLLGVLVPGPDLDLERVRVEAALADAGVLPVPPEPAEPAY